MTLLYAALFEGNLTKEFKNEASCAVNVLSLSEYNVTQFPVSSVVSFFLGTFLDGSADFFFFGLGLGVSFRIGG